MKKNVPALLAVLCVFSSKSGEAASRPALVFEKIFGGAGTDTGTAVAVDIQGNVYTAGTTTSSDFPLKNAFQPRIGSVPLRMSTDNGKTWTNTAITSPVYAVASSPKQNRVFFAGTQTGMYKSPDAGKTWVALTHGPQAVVNAVVVDSANPNLVYSGGNEGVLKSQDGGQTWRNVLENASVIVLIANPARSSTLFAAVAKGSAPNTPTLYRSTDSGTTWTWLSNSPIGAYALAYDPSNPAALYAAVSPAGFAGAVGSGLYKTEDSGDTWTKLANLPLAISTLAVAASPTAVFAATTKGLMRSTDGGITWATTSITVSAVTVAVDPINPQHVYVDAGGVFVSHDGGTTWSSSLPGRQYIQTISVVPSTPTVAFIGAAPGQNIFVSKWSSDGIELLYSTYLGGSYADFPTGLAVDDLGDAYVTGYTFSNDFPLTAGAVKTSNPGQYTAIIAKLSPDGKLLYSSYLGGSAGDAAKAIAVDNSGAAYVTGFTSSNDFPATNASQSTLKEGCSITFPSGGKAQSQGDSFVAKLDLESGVLGYATYLGGTCADEGLGITVDPSGNAYVVGVTASPDFPVTNGALNGTFPGNAYTGFLAKLTPQGALATATFLGGPGTDSASGVALDKKGNVYVTGSTFGFDKIIFGLSTSVLVAIRLDVNSLPVPGFAIDNAGAAYVLKLDSAASSRTYIKYIGGNFGNGSAIAVDPSGNSWIAGSTDPFSIRTGPPFPTVHPFQAVRGTGFVTQISADGATVLFSSFMDAASGLALDAAGNAFVLGTTTRSASYKYFYSSPLLDRIDHAVSSLVTVEEPQRLIPRLGSNYHFLGVAPGEIVVITGTGLGPEVEAAAEFTHAGTLATSLAGTSVMFDNAAAPLLSVQSERIVCLVPFEVANSQNSSPVMQVLSNNAKSNAIRLGATVSAVEVLAVANSSGSVNSAANPASPGSVVTVYAAGFGQTKPAGVDGQINGSGSLVVTPIGVNIGNQNAQILYAGPAPGQVAGITQINFVVPPLDPGKYATYVGWGPIKTFGDYNATSVYVGK